MSEVIPDLFNAFMGVLNRVGNLGLGGRRRQPPAVCGMPPPHRRRWRRRLGLLALFGGFCAAHVGDMGTGVRLLFAQFTSFHVLPNELPAFPHIYRHGRNKATALQPNNTKALSIVINALALCFQSTGLPLINK